MPKHTEEQRAKWREKYRNNKERYNRQSEKWAKENPLHMQASVHNALVKRRYPLAVTENSPKTSELKAWLEKGGKCVFCGEKGNHIDHILPLSRGGMHVWGNIRLLCKRCNYAKGNQTDGEFIGWLRTLVQYSSDIFGTN